LVQIVNTVPKPFSWSFSAVDNFHTCPKLYYHRNVAKDVSDDTYQRSEGREVHNILAKAVQLEQALPHHLRHWQRWIDELHRSKGEYDLRAEQKLAFTYNFEPCKFFDKVMKPWCRTVVDVLKIEDDEATVWDWKTGRIKPDEDQLLLCSTAVFAHHPNVRTINAGLIFLKEDTGPHIPRNNCTHEILIERKDLSTFWDRYEKKVIALEVAIRTNNFPANPSGLCKRHCPVTSCLHNGNYV